MSNITGEKKARKVDWYETRYSRSEIIGAASSFGVMPEVLAGALKLADKEELTRQEVEKAIESFKKRKVT